jgi:hypothetical protein
MSRPATITAAVLEKILCFLAPLFLGMGTDGIVAAREAASATLASHGARTDRELRLAALIVAFGFGALDALSRATDPELALNQVLRLRGNASALNRAAQQNETRLEKLLKQPEVEVSPTEAALDEPEATLPASIVTADLLTFARSRLNSMLSTAVPAAAAVSVTPLSRQQRRAAERKAEKARHRQQEDAKRAHRATQRLIASSEAVLAGGIPTGTLFE